MMEDFDESANAKGTREIKNGFISHKDNLVSAEGVHIDVLHLVIRTKEENTHQIKEISDYQ